MKQDIKDAFQRISTATTDYLGSDPEVITDLRLIASTLGATEEEMNDPEVFNIAVQEKEEEEEEKRW